MCDFTECQCHLFVMDSKTPLNLYLSAYFKRSFAFQTVKERMPIILTRLIDHLVRDRDEIAALSGEESREELKSVIGEISKLKYEIQTNKPILEFNPTTSDLKFYNWYLTEQKKSEGEPRFFTTVWLYAECYMYRKLRYIFENTNSLSKFDPFRKQKNEQFIYSLEAISTLTEHFLPLVKKPCTKIPHLNIDKELTKLLKLNLWGNRCDLSISGGAQNTQEISPMDMVDMYEEFILCDHTEMICDTLSQESDKKTVEFVCDNAGFEVFTDLCVADFIITHKLAEKIIFNIKPIPWFISDVTHADFRWMIRKLINSDNHSLKKLGIRWNRYIRELTWVVEDDEFWIYPVDFTYMRTCRPELYGRLSDAKLLVIKGDLNYRKLFGEKNWESTTPVETAVQSFHPAKLCALRTLKADMVCGLAKGVAEKLDESDPSWMVSGKYGVIQYSGLTKSVNFTG